MAAALCLLGAWLSWLLLYGLYAVVILLVETVRTGNVDLQVPFWFHRVGYGFLGATLIVAAVDRWRSRFRQVSDRNVLGWHAVWDLVLFPARLTLAIWDHVSARITLTPEELEDTWLLLQEVADAGRADPSRLGWKIRRPDRLGKFLLCLQLTGWIDLLRGENGWFYRVRSDEEPALKALRF